MKFNTLFRDVYSRISLFDNSLEIYALDVIRALNDAIKQQRLEYVNNGMGQAFAVNDDTYVVLDSMEYPFAGYFDLKRPLIKSAQIENAILTANVWVTDNELVDTPSSATIGDKVIKNGKLLKCVESFDNVNTFDRTFNNKHIRNYSRNNGLIYKPGDVVLDNESQSYYRCVDIFKANVNQPIEELPEFEKLYWFEFGSAYKTAVFYPMHSLQQLRVLEGSTSAYGFSVINDRVYVVPNTQRVNIIYVPEWEDVEDADADIEIPDFIVPNVKNQALNILGAKLGINLVDSRVREATPEEEDERT